MRYKFLDSSSSKAVVGQPDMKNSFIKTTKLTTAKSEKQRLKSNSASFNFEFNKMLFVSGLVQLMEEHNIAVPEKLLDKTDFIPQLLEFLGQYGVSLQTGNVPQFQLDSTHLLR